MGRDVHHTGDCLPRQALVSIRPNHLNANLYIIWHDVDPVDVFMLLHTRLDAAYQGLDLGTAEPIIDVNSGDNPYLAWTDEGEEELANRGHARVTKDKSAHSLLISWSEWLGEACNIATLLPPAPTQAPTRKSWLRWRSRRLTRTRISPMITAATPWNMDDPVI